MSEINLKELADKVIADTKELADVKSGIQSVKEAWASESSVLKKPLKAITAGISLVTDVVEHVEVLGRDLGLAGTQKKDLAVAVINKLIDLPFLNEGMEAIVIEFAIDTIVAAFNRKFGKGWLDRIGGL